jgi:para-aminobenzoate synthetase
MKGISDTIIRVLIIDHYDSYTNNILTLLQESANKDLDEPHSPAWQPVIIRYDQYKWCDRTSRLNVPFKHLLTDRNRDDFKTTVLPFFDAVILSPGPGRPDHEADFGFNSQLISEADIPILGICLGHQGIGTSFGAKIIHAPLIKHGQVSHIQHDGSGLFEGLPQGFEGVRYNSLTLDPDCKLDLFLVRICTKALKRFQRSWLQQLGLPTTWKHITMF